jgi:hypothetical protein
VRGSRVAGAGVARVVVMRAARVRRERCMVSEFSLLCKSDEELKIYLRMWK